MINSWPLCPCLALKTALPHDLILSPWPSWPGLARKVTLPSKRRSSPRFVSSVFKRQVSVRKCRKFWLAQGSWGRRVTLLLGATFLHIRGDLAVLGRPHVIGGEKYEQTKFGTYPENKRTATHRGLFWTAARLLGPRGLIGYLRDDMFLLLKEFISFFLLYLNLVIPPRFK